MSHTDDAAESRDMVSRRSARLAALAQYFDAHAAPLRRFAFYLCGDWGMADDLVQDAFLKVWRAGGRADRDGILSYSRHAIVSAHRSHFRRLLRERHAQRRSAVRERIEPVDFGDRDVVRDALLALPSQQRVCVALRHFEDLTEREIGELVGISEGSVRRHVSRGMAALRAALEGERP